MTWYRTSQFEDDGDYEKDPYLRDLVKEVSQDLFGPKMISTKACETTYDVDGVRVRLFVTISGSAILTLVGEDMRFEQFNLIDPKWLQSNWVERIGKNTIRGNYRHQDPENPQGPTYDDLPGGKKTLKDFVDGIRKTPGRPA